MNSLDIIVPLLNEEASFSELLQRLLGVTLAGPSPDSIRIVFVDDGSTDSTWGLIEEAGREHKRVCGVKLSRNFGHQAAILAGLDVSNKSSAVAILDGDLQDPPEALVDMWTRLLEGYDVVYAVRKTRSEPFWLRTCYTMYYRLLRVAASVEIPLDSGDFCMMSRRVADTVRNMPERRKFLRGLRAWVGFRQTPLPINRPPRVRGDTKYSIAKLTSLASTGLLSFSALPLRIGSIAGCVAVLMAALFAIYCIIVKLLYGISPTGFTAVILAITFLSGVQLLVLGVIGEYLGRLYEDQKARPEFVTAELLNLSSNDRGLRRSPDSP